MENDACGPTTRPCAKPGAVLAAPGLPWAEALPDLPGLVAARYEHEKTLWLA